MENFSLNIGVKLVIVPNLVWAEADGYETREDIINEIKLELEEALEKVGMCAFIREISWAPHKIKIIEIGDIDNV